MAEPVVEFIRVKKTINKQTIVDEVSLTVQQGQIVALCGANGAGKSTILRMLVGIMQPTEGTIRVNGIEWPKNRQAYANQIGFMPDDYRFTNGLTAKETLLFWSSLRGLPQERADEALAEVGLAETGKKPVSSFSKGMRQRVLFAQAMLARPPVLVLDEPTNGLDPYWMESFVQLIRELKKTGHTVIFSTHQLHIAEVLADRIVFMNQGRFELDDFVEDMKNRLGTTGLHKAFSGLYNMDV